jgi:Cna protein B-type domain.
VFEVKKALFTSIILILVLSSILSDCGGGGKSGDHSGGMTYTLTIAKQGNGTVNPDVGAHQYASGTMVTLSVTPDSNWSFYGWSGDTGSEVSSDGKITMNGNKTIQATFGQVEIGSVTITSQPAASISGQAIAGSPAVKVLGADNNPLAGVTVRVTEKDGVVFVSGSQTVTTDNNGIAVFNNLVLYEGQYTLLFTAGSKTAESSSFTVDYAGDGSQANPYQIHNLYGLDKVRNGLNKCYELENDIDATPTKTVGSAIWGFNSGINDGYPYLLNNQP